MSKYRATMPREAAAKGRMHFVFSVKDEHGERIELSGPNLSVDKYNRVMAILMSKPSEVQVNETKEFQLGDVPRSS